MSGWAQYNPHTERPNEMTPEPSFGAKVEKIQHLIAWAAGTLQAIKPESDAVTALDEARQLLDDLHAREPVGLVQKQLETANEELSALTSVHNVFCEGVRKAIGMQKPAQISEILDRVKALSTPTLAQPQGEWSVEAGPYTAILYHGSTEMFCMSVSSIEKLRNIAIKANAELAAVREELRRLKFAINMSCDYPAQKKIKELVKPSLECDRIAREAWEQIRQVCEYNKFDPIIFNFDNGPTIIKDAINRALTCKNPR